FVLDAFSTAPFATGLGIEHPLENGFAFLNPYGLPYLPGSSIKGVLRQAARELQEDGEPRWQCIERRDAEEEIDPIVELFGSITGDDGKRGALLFWDAFPVLPRNSEALAPDVMTPHQTHYYRDGQPPHDSGQPNPILFVTIPPGAQFEFYVGCKPALLKPELAENNRWQTLLQGAFEYAFDWLGFGAKTAVGYGQMEVDASKQQEREHQAEAQQAQAAEDERVAANTANLPADAAWLEENIQRGAWSQGDNAALLDGLEPWLKGLQVDALSPQAWQRIEALLHDRWKGLLDNPDAVKGKKQKAVFKDRPRKLAKRLLEIKANGEAS
ncbi:MAG: type III-B CRISPR module RAMP protein Cmr6, partial [Nitrosospira sp.]|nr:type III-B CRISPR module RAMP protein Cmr6 [Nitrosospira sp.]